MPDLATRIRQRLDAISQHIAGCCSCTTCEAQDAVHAVRAVLDLQHGPTVAAVAEALGMPADPSPWTWLPNADMTRLHACHEAERYVWRGEQRATAACGAHLPVPTVALSGDMPPRCKRCVKAVEG